MSEYQGHYLVMVREEMTGAVVVAADSKEEAAEKMKEQSPHVGTNVSEWNNNSDTFQVEEVYGSLEIHEDPSADDMRGGS